jgi:hypothetical protein
MHALTGTSFDRSVIWFEFHVSENQLGIVIPFRIKVVAVWNVSYKRAETRLGLHVCTGRGLSRWKKKAATSQYKHNEPVFASAAAASTLSSFFAAEVFTSAAFTS